MATSTVSITTPPCMMCSKTSVVEVTEDEAGKIARRAAGERLMIQDILADRDANFRELVMTGIHEACWPFSDGDES